MVNQELLLGTDCWGRLPFESQSNCHIHKPMPFDSRLERKFFKSILMALVYLFSLGDFVGVGWAQNLYPITRDGLDGFVESSGKVVIKPRFLVARSFHEGLAAVEDASTYECGFINPSGEMEILPQFVNAESFSEGLAAVSLDGSIYGFINHKGEIVIKPAYKLVEAFHEGLAAVKKGYEWEGDSWLFIDKTGTPVESLKRGQSLRTLEDHLVNAQSFSEGVAAVDRNFIDHAGGIVSHRNYSSVSSFSEGLAGVIEKDKSGVGFIDRSEVYVISPRFEEAGAFSEGLAAVMIDHRWGYIDRTGKLVIANTFPSFANDFVGGLAEVDDPVRGAAMYIDLTGKVKFFKNPAARSPHLIGGGIIGGKPKAIHASSRTPCILTLKSDPEGADVYLVPEYIWCCGGQGQPSPEELPDPALTKYLKSNINFHLNQDQGRTPFTIEVQEENFCAIFVRNEQIDKEFVTVHLGYQNSVMGRFKNP